MDTDTFWGLTSAGWTGIYALLTGILVILACLAAIYTHKQLSAAKLNAQEAIRPYVTVTVEPSLATHRMFDLVIRNVGQRPAVNTTIRMYPLPVRAQETLPNKTRMADMKIINEPITLLAPRQELRVFYDNQADRTGRNDLPTAHEVTLSYSDTSHVEYHGQFSLDLQALAGASTVDVNTLHDIGKSLKQIEKTMSHASLLTKEPQLNVNAVVESHLESLTRQLDELDARIRFFSDTREPDQFLLDRLEESRGALHQAIQHARKRNQQSLGD